MRQAAPLALLIGTVACVAAPPATRPETKLEIPETWTASAAKTDAGIVSEHWWRDFGDPGLEAIVEQALEHNTDLLVAAARLQQAEAAARIAGADLKSQLGVGIAGSRRKQNFVGFPIPGGEDRVLTTTSTNYGVSLELSWEIDLWGRLSAQAREGLANYQASRADLAAVRLSIAAQTAKAWFALAEARQQVLLAEQMVDSFDRSAAQVRRRFERGIRPSLDLRLALSQLATAEASLDTRHRQLDLTARQLEVLVGRYPGRDLQIPEQLIETPAPIPSGLPADLVSRRPDLTAAERRLVAADQRFRIARASLYPRLSLTASGGTSSNQLEDLVKGNFSIWSLLGNLTAPLFQGGRLRAGVDLAQAGIDENLFLYVGTALRAYAEVEFALAAEKLLADRVDHLGEASRQSLAAQSQAEARYRSGLNDYITVLESQRRYFEAQSAHIAGRRERLDNRVDLYLALGGGFDGHRVVAQPAEPVPVASLPESSR